MTTHETTSLIRIARRNGETEIAAPLNLGDRVRELRQAKEWTMERAANQAGLARSTFSKIENGQMSPTYDALKKLAEGLEISVPQLFTPPSKGRANGRMVVTKTEDAKHAATATYEHEGTVRRNWLEAGRAVS